MKNPDFIFDLIDLLSKHDLMENTEWECCSDTEEIKCYVNCNDLFVWGCADLEEITPCNFHILKECIADLNKVNDTAAMMYAVNLFCCRIRRLRPQGAAYPRDNACWFLFNQCGPERKVGFGNPKQPGG